MEEYIVGPVLDKLIESLSHYLQDQFRWQTCMKKELESLRENYSKIQAVISTAKRAQTGDQNSALNKWIWQLRDAIDEADDLLDGFEYKKLKKQTIRRNLIKVGKRALKIDPDLTKLEEVVKKLDRISAEVSTFLHLLDNNKQVQREQQVELHKTRQTGSLPRNDLIGRGMDMEFIIQWLSKPSNEEHQTNVTATTLYNNISLLSIVGHGGMGKTTLLQHVYQDKITKEFDLKMWVCVSDSFDVNKVIKDMLECFENERPSLDSLHALQERLKSKVMSRKFLLVLDDLWDKEEEVALLNKWENVLAPLAYGGLGSKVLITTRMDPVASMIAKVIGKKKEAFILKGLEEDECLQLLITHAFAFGENPNDHENLTSIARELVKKLFGSPLAAKVIGGVLNSSLDEGHWRNVLNNSLGLTGIFPILKLSYIFLSEHLQSCFSFCSIFEQDHVFNKDDLVHMWIAVGFIQPSDNNQGETLTLEDIGERYFDVLIKKYFFYEVLNEDYKMHDLLHELAQSVSTQECFRFMGDEKTLHLKIPETIRHLFVKTSNPKVLKKLRCFKNLRTLFITCHDEGVVDALNEMLKVTRSIRLLCISSFNMRVIPDAVGYLLHLRYLAFNCPDVMVLPRSLSSLYHLQFIILGIYYRNDYSNCSFQWNSPNGNVDFKLTKFFEKLKGFCIKNEKDYRIEVLEHMNELRILRINDLKDMRDAQEACKVKLCDKRKLMNLFLNWNHSKREIADRDLDERVLDNLQPHNYLKILDISHYMGARSAIWMNEAHLINNLQEIELYDCLEWEILPPFGQLPFLKTLRLWNMPKVKRFENKFHGNDMCSVFPSLETLCFEHLDVLVDWFDESVDGFFPSLTKLKLCYCPNLQEMPYLPPKLKSLEIYNIGWKSLNCFSISKFIHLETLEVSACQNITSISLGGEICKLKKLRIATLTSLQSLPSSLANISSLEILKLIELPQLRELPDLPLSLKELVIFQCDPELMKRHEQFSSNC